jgi:TonB family protein
MTEVPGFLLELGLRADADERAVRRAYAVQLKQLDQAAQPLQFQQLREAYEAALHWARQARDVQEAEAAQAPPPPPSPPEAVVDAAPEPAPPPAPAEPRPDPVRDILVALDTRLQQEPLRSVPEATALLEHTLEDPRLLDMDARFRFEANIAHLLACGWRPGHEHLFEAALVFFDWRTDSARLLRLGQAGQVVDRAIVEQDAQGQQAPLARDSQLEYLELLRRTARPEPRALALGLGPVMHAAAHYPTWLRLTSNTANIEAWNERNADLARASAPRVNPKAPVYDDSVSTSQMVTWFLAFCGVVLLIVLLKAAPTWETRKTPPTARELAGRAGAAAMADALRNSRTQLPSDPSLDVLTRAPNAPAMSAPHRPPIEPDPPAARYTTAPRPIYPALSKRLGEQGIVTLKVRADARGAVSDAVVLQGSGYTRLDNAAIDAVREAQVVPRKGKDGRSVGAWYKASIQFTLNDADRPAGTATPPAPRRSYGERVTAAVRPNIAFSNDVAGNPAVEYTLALRPDGRIMDARLSKASGVPEWDAAALRAILRTDRMPLTDDGTVPSSMVLVLRPKLQ